MKFKDVAISDASTEAKVAALAVLLDKELLKLAETVLNVQAIEGAKGEQGLQGPKGEQGDRGFDGTNGKDGSDGKDGKDGAEGKQGVGVQDAKIDFDGSLVITLTDGTEINAGEVVPLDTAEKIRVIGNGGGTSQSVLDAIDAINAVIATYGTMALQNKTSVDIEGGTIDGTVIGNTTPAAGTFTALSTGTLTAPILKSATGSAIAGVSLETPLGAQATIIDVGDGTRPLRINGGSAGAVASAGISSSTGFLQLSASNSDVRSYTGGRGATLQFNVSHTASAVNYVQVTGAATGSAATISAQGSDSNIFLQFYSKGSNGFNFYSGNGTGRQLRIDGGVTSSVNFLGVQGATTSQVPILSASAQSSDTNVGLAIQSKGTGAIDLAAGSSGVNISNGGTVTAITRTAGGTGYATAPTVAISAPTTAGGVQATATVAVSAGAITTFTITNAGSGYVEQPTVSFSGGGGSGAAAYATVGAEPTIKSLFGSTGAGLALSTAYGPQLRLLDIGDGTRPLNINGGSAGGAQIPGITAASVLGLSAGGGNNIAFYTNGRVTTQQFAVAHTASAVNYVQVTGAATGGNPVISAQGSDSNIRLYLGSKGSSAVRVVSNAGTVFDAIGVSSAANFFNFNNAAASGTPSIAVVGSDTNIDLTLTPKGTGNVRFGTYTASVLAPTGYIEIKDSGGTTRRLLVG